MTVYLLTGISASGKSTVAQALAERLPRSVHVRGDVFRKMVVNGRADMGPDAGEEALRQLRLRYRLAASTADAYAAEDFSVVVQDVILGHALARFVEMIHTRPLYVIVLAPSADVVAEREKDRNKAGYDQFAIEQLDRGLREDTPRIGLWLDTSAQTVAETVDEILARAPAEAAR